MAKCLSPSLIRNRKYKDFTDETLSIYAIKHFGDYALKVQSLKSITGYYYKPPDEYINIPCGCCYNCLKTKRNNWVTRLSYECFAHKENTFVTLTFDDEHLDKFKDDYKRPLKLYIDRLRKSLGYRPRYWFISEYGDEEKYSGRLHFHGIIFGSSAKTMSFHLMREKWTYGHSFLGYCKAKTINYVVKYITKTSELKPILMCSNGIGLFYLKTQKDIYKWHLNNFDPRMYIPLGNIKMPMSPYYKNKLFNEEIRQILSINLLTSYINLRERVEGTLYTDEEAYKIARDVFYQFTLRNNMSLPKPKQKFNITNYGKLCISQSGLAESWQIEL